MNLDELKKEVAEKAVECVKDGMIVGLGSGSTTRYALLKIAKLLKEGKLKNILGIPSSEATKHESLRLGIPLTTFEEHSRIDLTIDGADEVDPDLNLIKGGGGALLREKVLSQASSREIIIVDETKLSNSLGEKWALPIEVIPFAVNIIEEFLLKIGAKSVSLRKNGDDHLFITDEGNHILDADFGIIDNPKELATKLSEKAGIVEHGLFIDLAHEVVVATSNGIKELKK